MSAKKRLMVLTLMSAGFIGSLSQNLLTSALPTIIADFGVSTGTGQWLTTVYILILGVITAMSAYLFSRFHTKTLVAVSLLTFLAGCVPAYFARSFYVLLFSRVVQALGAGALIPLLQVAVMHIYPKEKQGRALGLTGIVVGFAPAIGTTLSGVLVDGSGWRSIFLLLIILSALILAAACFSVEETGERSAPPMDFFSALLYAAGFVLLMLGVTLLDEGRASGAAIALMFAFSVVCLFVFTRRQLCSETPLLKLSLLKDPSLRCGTALLGVSYILMMTGAILVPLYIQTLCDLSATVSGLVLLPGSLLIAVLSPVVGRMCDRRGAVVPCIIGTALLLLGNSPFIAFGEQSGMTLVAAVYAVRCVGLAFMITATTTLGVSRLRLEDKAHGTAILNSLRQICGSVFSTVIVAVASLCSGAEDLNINGFHAAFGVMSALSLAALLYAAIYARHRKIECGRHH